MSGGSFLHQAHRWLGREVEDTVTGRRGILTAVAPEGADPRARPLAWLRPLGGGTEWTTFPAALANPSPSTSARRTPR
ncbi:hypothetical protein ACFY9F_36735 [Streptomyces sp. NPDC012421]|uniref:hypothetical protein n=1 Tax=Streptomyces sp. NPDC012421 TaxID=3364832 RepID=UPI0036E87709